MSGPSEFVAFLYAAAHDIDPSEASGILAEQPDTLKLYERIADAAELFVEDKKTVLDTGISMTDHRNMVRAATKALREEVSSLGRALIKRFPFCRDCDSNSVEVFDDDSALRDFGF